MQKSDVAPEGASIKTEEFLIDVAPEAVPLCYRIENQTVLRTDRQNERAKASLRVLIPEWSRDHQPLFVIQNVGSCVDPEILIVLGRGSIRLLRPAGKFSNPTNLHNSLDFLRIFSYY
jgi:hypothetical protein